MLVITNCDFNIIGDGCGRKRKTESAQKTEECVDRSSPVIEAFKCKAIHTIICCQLLDIVSNAPMISRH